MNYVYDLVLNFNKNLYDFFDWNIDDNIVHIRKIPIFKLDNNMYKDLKNYDIVVSGDFLVKISNRCEIFTKQNVKIINHACLFTNGLEVIAIKFDDNGKSIEKSKLLLDEEDEILYSIDDFELYSLKYKIVEENCSLVFKTRKEDNIYKFIDCNLKKLRSENIDALKYLYYECFNEKNADFRKMLPNINRLLDENWEQNYMKVYNFFKLITVKEK